MRSRPMRQPRRAGRLAGGLLLAAAAASAAVVSLADAISAVAAALHSVQIVNSGGSCASTFCFQPASVTAAAGDTVTWSNGSFASHTITRCDPANCQGQGGGTGSDSLSSPTVGSGGTFSHTFNSAGTYIYFCAIHGYAAMHGQVAVSAAQTPPPGPTPRPTPRATPRPSSHPAPRMSPPVAGGAHTPRPTATATPSPAAPVAVVVPTGTPTGAPATGGSTPTGAVGATAPPATGSPALAVIAGVVVVGLAAGAHRARRRRSASG